MPSVDTLRCFPPQGASSSRQSSEPVRVKYEECLSLIVVSQELLLHKRSMHDTIHDRIRIKFYSDYNTCFSINEQ